MGGTLGSWLVVLTESMQGRTEPGSFLYFSHACTRTAPTFASQVDGVKGGCVVVELRQADAEALGLVTGGRGWRLEV